MTDAERLEHARQLGGIIEIEYGAQYRETMRWLIDGVEAALRCEAVASLIETSAGCAHNEREKYALLGAATQLRKALTGNAECS